MDEALQKITEMNGLLVELGMPYIVQLVEPKSLKLLDKNARYMDKEMFDQLVSNIRRDGALSSVPLCHDDGKGLTVLSGNHRVMAAREAGLDRILVMVTDKPLTRGEKVAVQLSHNALVGKDDMATLKSLWGEIDEMELKRYAGLDSQVLAELDKMEFVSISEVNLDVKVVTLAFLPEDADALKQAVADADIYFQGEESYLLSRKHYEAVFNLAADVKEKYNIMSNPIAFMKIVELARENMEARG